MGGMVKGKNKKIPKSCETIYDISLKFLKNSERG